MSKNKEDRNRGKMSSKPRGKFKTKLYQSLPKGILGDEFNSGNAADRVEDYLSGNVPLDDINASHSKSILYVGRDVPSNEHHKTVSHEKRRLSKRLKRAMHLGKKRVVSSITYVDAIKMNKLWISFMYNILGLTKMDANQKWYEPSSKLYHVKNASLLKADYQGAAVTVTRSKCQSLIGKTGIIISDTKQTFRIITPANEIKTIPKDTCVFSVKLKRYKLEIFGKYFCIRPSERSIKKIKIPVIPDL